MITQEHKDRIKTSVVSKLRQGQNINLVDKERGYIHRIQINKKEKGVCFERWVKCIGATASDRWINWNLYLSIKDVVSINTHLVEKNLELKTA